MSIDRNLPIDHQPSFDERISEQEQHVAALEQKTNDMFMEIATSEGFDILNMPEEFTEEMGQLTEARQTLTELHEAKQLELIPRSLLRNVPERPITPEEAKIQKEAAIAASVGKEILVPEPKQKEEGSVTALRGQFAPARQTPSPRSQPVSEKVPLAKAMTDAKVVGLKGILKKPKPESKLAALKHRITTTAKGAVGVVRGAYQKARGGKSAQLKFAPPPEADSLKLFYKGERRDLSEIPPRSVGSAEVEIGALIRDRDTLYTREASIPFGPKGSGFFVDTTVTHAKGVAKEKFCCEDFSCEGVANVVVEKQEVGVAFTASWDGAGGHHMAESAAKNFGDKFEARLQEFLDRGASLDAATIDSAMKTAMEECTGMDENMTAMKELLVRQSALNEELGGQGDNIKSFVKNNGGIQAVIDSGEKLQFGGVEYDLSDPVQAEKLTQDFALLAGGPHTRVNGTANAYFVDDMGDARVCTRNLGSEGDCVTVAQRGDESAFLAKKKSKCSTSTVGTGDVLLEMSDGVYEMGKTMADYDLGQIQEEGFLATRMAMGDVNPRNDGDDMTLRQTTIRKEEGSVTALRGQFAPARQTPSSRKKAETDEKVAGLQGVLKTNTPPKQSRLAALKSRITKIAKGAAGKVSDLMQSKAVKEKELAFAKAVERLNTYDPEQLSAPERRLLDVQVAKLPALADFMKKQGEDGYEVKLVDGEVKATTRGGEEVDTWTTFQAFLESTNYSAMSETDRQEIRSLAAQVQYGTLELYTSDEVARSFLDRVDNDGKAVTINVLEGVREGVQGRLTRVDISDRVRSDRIMPSHELFTDPTAFVHGATIGQTATMQAGSSKIEAANVSRALHSPYKQDKPTEDRSLVSTIRVGGDTDVTFALCCDGNKGPKLAELYTKHAEEVFAKHIGSSVDEASIAFALVQVKEELYEMYENMPDYTGDNSTFTAVVLFERAGEVYGVCQSQGDSGAIKIKASGDAERLNCPGNLGGQPALDSKGKAGMGSAEKPVSTRANSVTTFKLEKGENILLVSDGIWHECSPTAAATAISEQLDVGKTREETLWGLMHASTVEGSREDDRNPVLLGFA